MKVRGIRGKELGFLLGIDTGECLERNMCRTTGVLLALAAKRNLRKWQLKISIIALLLSLSKAPASPIEVIWADIWLLPIPSSFPLPETV